MNTKIKEKWLKALRSGEYEQGQSYLRSNDQYCCLGVLCDLVSPENWVEDRFAGGGIYSHMGKEEMPSGEIYSQVELDVLDAGNLASMNDDGDSFEQIANYIEEKL